jgi:myo-inositol 2-dehydrogenase / D-chiro-inositol 1-dehydrogenase
MFFGETVTMSDASLLRQNIQQSGHSRRQFLGGALTAAAVPLLGVPAGLAADAAGAPRRKIKLGLVGCGGRGSMLAGFFREHGGYELHAVADYFQEKVDACGNAQGVDKGRRFSGLSGYKRVIESGVEAIALETPPCFFPEHAHAAVDAGLHVYLAKPVAVDVPGCLTIEAAGKLATQKRRVFLVDYQIPTEPANIRVAERIRNGEMGRLARIATTTITGGYHVDPPKTATIESRLKDNVWNNDIALGGSIIAYFDIHMIDAAIWVLGQHPVAAMGAARTRRPDPHGDDFDVYSVIFDYADGLLHAHNGQCLASGASGPGLTTAFYAQFANAAVTYDREARFQIRGQHPFTARISNLYPTGAKRNIAAFYEDICVGRVENPTVRRAVDGCLACILGREAALRNGRLTMEELLTENKRLELDLAGLKV